jgi:hypothetical protein
MKRLVLVTVIAVAVLAWCAPAFAWPVALPWWKPSAHFTCAGRIQAVDPTAGAVTMRVRLASRGAADYLGDDLTIVAATGAHVFKASGAAHGRISLSDLVVGEQLRVEGTIDYSSGSAVFTGKRLVMHRLPLDEIKRFAFRGAVTAVDAAAGTLSATMVRVTRALSPFYHADRKFVVAPDVRLWVMKNGWPVRATLADVATGDKVSAQGGADRSTPSAPVFTIRWMIVRHATAAAVTP